MSGGGGGGKRALEAEKRRQYDVDDGISSPGFLRNSGGSSGRPSFSDEKHSAHQSMDGGYLKDEHENSSSNRRSVVGDIMSSMRDRDIELKTTPRRRDTRDYTPTLADVSSGSTAAERREDRSKPVAYESRGVSAGGDAASKGNEGWRTPTRANAPPVALQRSPQQQPPVRYPTTLRASPANRSPLPEKYLPPASLKTTSGKSKEHKLVASPVPKAKYRHDPSSRSGDPKAKVVGSLPDKKEKRSLRSNFPESRSALEKLHQRDHAGVFEDGREGERENRTSQPARERNSTPEAQRLPAREFMTKSPTQPSNVRDPLVRERGDVDAEESWRSVVEASVSPQRGSGPLLHIARSPQRLSSAAVSRMLESIAATPPRAPLSTSVSPQRAADWVDSSPAEQQQQQQQRQHDPLHKHRGTSDSTLPNYGASTQSSSRGSVSPQKISVPQGRDRPTMASCTDHISSTVRPLNMENFGNSASESILSFASVHASQGASLDVVPDNRFSVTSPPLRAVVSPRTKPIPGASSTHASQSSSAPGSPANHGGMGNKYASDSSHHMVLSSQDRVISPMTTLGPVQADIDENGSLIPVPIEDVRDPNIEGYASAVDADDDNSSSSSSESQGDHNEAESADERAATGKDADSFPPAPLLTSYGDKDPLPTSHIQLDSGDEAETQRDNVDDDENDAPATTTPKMPFIQESSSASARLNYSGFYNNGNECYACSVLTFLLRNRLFTSALKTFVRHATLIGKFCKQDGWNCRARVAEKAARIAAGGTTAEGAPADTLGSSRGTGAVSGDDDDYDDEVEAPSQQADSIPELSVSERKQASLPLHAALLRFMRKMSQPDTIPDGIDLDYVADLLEGDFFNGIQQDAHEFFVAVTVMLEDEVVAFWKEHTPHRHEMEGYGEVWINAVMQGKLLNIIYCANVSCGHTIVTTEPYINISLAIPQRPKKEEAEEKVAVRESENAHGEKCSSPTSPPLSSPRGKKLPNDATSTLCPSTQELLKSSLACEALDTYVCDSCKSSKQQYQLGCFFSTPPKLLTLQVKRFLASFNAKQGIFTSKKDRSPIDLNHNITVLSIPSELYSREDGMLSSPFIKHLSGALQSSSSSSSSSSESESTSCNDHKDEVQTVSPPSHGSVSAIETHYRLQSAVLHIGRTLNCGHYVAEYAEKRDEVRTSLSRAGVELDGSEQTKKRPRETSGEEDSDLTVMEVVNLRGDKKESDDKQTGMNADEFFNDNNNNNNNTEPPYRDYTSHWEWRLANDEAICRLNQEKVKESHRSCSEAYLLLYEKVHERRVQVPVSRFFSSLPPQSDPSPHDSGAKGDENVPAKNEELKAEPL